MVSVIRPTIRDVTDDEARAAFPLKWGAVEPGVVPAWLAEMDYRLAPVVEDAIVEAVRRGTAGYPPQGDAGVGRRSRGSPSGTGTGGRRTTRPSWSAT